MTGGYKTVLDFQEKITSSDVANTVPCDTPGFTFLQPEVWSFSKTLCFRSLRQHSNKDSKSTSTLQGFNLNKRPLCQTLSNALDMSKKTPVTSTGELLKKVNFMALFYEWGSTASRLLSLYFMNYWEKLGNTWISI